MVNGPKPNANKLNGPKPNANKPNGPKPNANKLTANKLKGEYLPRSDGLKRYTRSQSGEYLGGIEALGLLGYDAGSIIGRKVANASTSTVRGFSKLGSKLFKKSKNGMGNATKNNNGMINATKNNNSTRNNKNNGTRNKKVSL